MNISQFQNWPSNTYFCQSLLPALENCIFLGCSSEGNFASSFHCERCRFYTTQSQIIRGSFDFKLFLLKDCCPFGSLLNISQFQNWPSNTYFCQSLLPALENCIFLGCSSEGNFASSFHCERCRFYTTQSQIIRGSFDFKLFLLEVSSESCVLLHYIAEQRVSPERLPCCICPVIEHIPLTSYLSLQTDLRPLIDLDTRLRNLIDQDSANTYRRNLSRELDFFDLRTLVDDTKEGCFEFLSSLTVINLWEQNTRSKTI